MEIFNILLLKLWYNKHNHLSKLLSSDTVSSQPNQQSWQYFNLQKIPIITHFVASVFFFFWAVWDQIYGSLFCCLCFWDKEREIFSYNETVSLDWAYHTEEHLFKSKTQRITIHENTPQAVKLVPLLVGPNDLAFTWFVSWD